MLGTSCAQVEPMLGLGRRMLGLCAGYVGVCWPHVGICWPYVEPSWRPSRNRENRIFFTKTTSFSRTPASESAINKRKTLETKNSKERNPLLSHDPRPTRKKETHFVLTAPKSQRRPIPPQRKQARFPYALPLTGSADSLRNGCRRGASAQRWTRARKHVMAQLWNRLGDLQLLRKIAFLNT